MGHAGRQLAKRVIKGCMICRRARSKPGNAPSAPLPKNRIEESPPFSIIGVDYAGPLYIKGPRYYETEKSLDKAYICLFTCAVTRALHLELVLSMTTEEFLLAFKRMVARRGKPTHIYSDNGKYFKRANKDLTKIWEILNNKKLLEYYGNEGISWQFIVERASWWGGFYERLVGSTKVVLKKILGKATLNYQEMETVLAETEAAINSRPLTFVFNEASEPSPLSPAHFLVGKRLTSLPPQYSSKEIVPSNREELTKRYKYRQSLNDRLWQRWQSEYLLQLRSAHHAKNKQKDNLFKVGEVVLIHQDKVPKHIWKLGLVTELIIGRDGKVRACQVKTANGNIIRRPVQTLYSLEVVDDVK